MRETCRRLGWEFDGWQDGAGMLTLSQCKDGEYAADTVVISIPRQVGKTYLIGCIIFALCLMKPGLRVIWTAQVKDTALETFDQFLTMAQRPKVKALEGVDEELEALERELMAERAAAQAAKAGAAAPAGPAKAEPAKTEAATTAAAAPTDASVARRKSIEEELAALDAEDDEAERSDDEPELED